MKCGKWFKLPNNISIILKVEKETGERICRVCKKRIELFDYTVVVKYNSHSNRHYHLKCFIDKSPDIVGVAFHGIVLNDGGLVLCCNDDGVSTRNKWDISFLKNKVLRYIGMDVAGLRKPRSMS